MSLSANLSDVFPVFELKHLFICSADDIDDPAPVLTDLVSDTADEQDSDASRRTPGSSAPSNIRSSTSRETANSGVSLSLFNTLSVLRASFTALVCD